MWLETSCQVTFRLGVSLICPYSVLLGGLGEDQAEKGGGAVLYFNIKALSAHPLTRKGGEMTDDSKPNAETQAIGFYKMPFLNYTKFLGR